MLWYLFLDIICSSKLAVPLELCFWKTVRFSEQIVASLRTEKKRDDAGWSSCCACVFPCLLASWQRRGGQFDLSDRVATCRHYDDYGWESLFKKVRFWVQITFFLFHMGFRRFLQTNFLYIHGWLANETSKLLCSGCISPWEQHQERASLFPSSLLPN